MISNKIIQAIIINDSSVLCRAKYDGNDQTSNRFIRSELFENEAPDKTLEKLINEQLNTSSRVVFKLTREVYSNTVTYLVNIDVTDSLREELEGKGFKWIPLKDRNNFSYNEKVQLSNLLLSCIDNGYSHEFTNSIKEMISSDSSLGYYNTVISSRIRTLEHRSIDANTSRTDRAFAVFAAIFLGFIFNMIFFKNTLGVSYPIFILMIILFFIYSFKKQTKWANPMGVFLLGISFILSLSFGIHSNGILGFLNFIAIPLLLSASFILIRYENIYWSSMRFVLSVFERILPSSFENLRKPFVFVRNNVRKKERGKLSPKSRGILTGLLVSVPLLVIILPLLSSADSVFGYYTSNFFNNLEKVNIGTTTWDIIRSLIIALYLFGFFWSFKYSFARDTKPFRVNGKLEPITVLTVLVMINLVYLFFTVIQFSYLYGGETSLPNGFTYAEYARRGFFELVLVTIINFTILLLSTVFTKKETPLRSILNISYTLLIAFTINMLYSAHYKMSLYESAFGYTYLRIFVHFFLLLLLILFLIALAGIWLKKVPAAKLSIIAALLMYVFINYVNVDSIIAAKNIERYYQTGKIDIYYLTRLSYDAVPNVASFSKNSGLNDNVRKDLKYYFDVKEKSLARDYKWYEFNYSKFTAEKSFNK